MTDLGHPRSVSRRLASSGLLMPIPDHIVFLCGLQLGSHPKCSCRAIPCVTLMSMEHVGFIQFLLLTFVSGHLPGQKSH